MLEWLRPGALPFRYHLLMGYAGDAFRVVCWEAVRAGSKMELERLNGLLGQARGNFARAGIALADGPRSGAVLGGDQDQWDERDLYNLLNPQNFPTFRPNEMAWQVFLLVAPWFRGDPDRTASVTTGVMFDDKDANPRQGAAVFWRGCERAAEKAPPPGATGEAGFAEWFSWTVTHEVGHAFNLLHTYHPDKRLGPHRGSPSFMNYPSEYSGAGGAGDAAYWEAHRAGHNSFDSDELVTLRHAHLSRVIMGGETFGAGGHSRLRLRPPTPDRPLGLTLRFRPAPADNLFPFGSPVHVEAKLERRTRGVVEADDALDPAHGVTEYFVRTPGGEVRQFHPLARRCSTGRLRHLTARRPALYEDVQLTYGAGGWTFLEPGRYQVQAVYTGSGGPVASDVLTFWVGHPPDPARERRTVRALDPAVAAYLAVWGNRETADQVAGAVDELVTHHPKHPLAVQYRRCRAYERTATHRRVRFRRGQPQRVEVVGPQAGPGLVDEVRDVLGLGKQFEGTPGAADPGLSNILYAHLAGALIRILQADGARDGVGRQRVGRVCQAVRSRVLAGATGARSPQVVMADFKRKWGVIAGASD